MLVSQLTGLPLPNESSRCPIMYVLNNAPDIGDACAEWHCQLTLVRHLSPTSELFERVHGEPFGAPLRRKDELVHALRAAVDALLVGGADFTRDVVCVNVLAADVPDLCVFDIPGLGVEEFYARERRAVAKACSTGGKTALLVTLPCDGKHSFIPLHTHDLAAGSHNTYRRRGPIDL